MNPQEEIYITDDEWNMWLNPPAPSNRVEIQPLPTVPSNQDFDSSADATEYLRQQLQEQAIRDAQATQKLSGKGACGSGCGDSGGCGSGGKSGGCGGGGGGLASLFSAVCTATAMMGEIPLSHLDADYRAAYKMHPWIRTGYMFWGIPLARQMFKHACVAKFMIPWAKMWTELMAYEEGVEANIDWLTYLVMKPIKAVGVSVCFLIGGILHVLRK